MPEPHSDALVLFGATGDLAYEQIFPMAEAFGVRGRGGFYEGVGAVRDVFQNHLLQVLSLLAMDRAKTPAWSNTAIRATRWSPTSACSATRCEGTATLFGSEADVEAAWRIVDPILKGYEPPCECDRGSWGPTEAERIAPQTDGWIEPGGDQSR